MCGTHSAVGAADWTSVRRAPSMTTAIRMAVPIVWRGAGQLSRYAGPRRATLPSGAAITLPRRANSQKGRACDQAAVSVYSSAIASDDTLQWRAVALHWNAHALVCAYGTFQWPTTV